MKIILIVLLCLSFTIVEAREWNRPSFTEDELSYYASELLELEEEIRTNLEVLQCSTYPLRNEISNCANDMLSDKAFRNYLDLIDNEKGEKETYYKTYFMNMAIYCAMKIDLENVDTYCKKR